MTDLRVRTGGGGPPTLLLLHGLGATADVWTGLTDRLSDRLDGAAWVAPDLPGHGGSPPLPAYSFAAVADAVAGLVDPRGTVVEVVRAGGGRDSRDLALVARAREAIRADDPAAGGLLPLAAMLGVSPFRLSRAFSRQLGVPVTRYRNRVRVERALDRLEAGADDLAALAADLGFADQAHLCRTMRQHLGEPPSAVRRLLG